MSIKPAFLFIASINIKSDSGKRIRIPLPIPLILFLSLALSTEELIDFALLFSKSKYKRQLKLFKASTIVFKTLMMQLMFTMGPYDFISVDAGDADNRVKIRIQTK